MKTKIIKEEDLTKSSKFSDYPKSAQEDAKKVLDWKKKYPKEVKAMTAVGWARARQLASGKSLSYDVVKRMAAFIRHKKNSNIKPEFKSEPWKDKGYVAWLGWGGTSGINWAISKVNQVEKKDRKKVEESYTMKNNKSSIKKPINATKSTQATKSNSSIKSTIKNKKTVKPKVNNENFIMNNKERILRQVLKEASGNDKINNPKNGKK